MVANWKILNKEFDDLMNKLSDDEWINWYNQIDAQKESLRKDLLLSAKIQETKNSLSGVTGESIYNDVQSSLPHIHIDNKLSILEDLCKCEGGDLPLAA